MQSDASESVKISSRRGLNYENGSYYRLNRRNRQSDGDYPGQKRFFCVNTRKKRRDAGEGAITPVYLATSDEAANITGKYFSDLKIVKPNPVSHDINARKKLWRLSEELIRQNGFTVNTAENYPRI